MNVDNGLLTGLSLIDFRKAFDLVDQGVLLRKFVTYQLSEESIQWFKSYLEGRLQKISINDVISSSLPKHHGFHKAQFWVRSCSSFSLTIYR